MNIKLKIQENERKDFGLNSGDLLYNLDRDEYFQIICLDKMTCKYMIYNLKENTYMSDNIYTTDGKLMYSDTIKRINSRYCDDTIKWIYVGRENYNLEIVVNK